MYNIYLKYNNVLACFESLYVIDYLSKDGSGAKLGDKIMVITPSGEIICLMIIPLQYHTSIATVLKTVEEAITKFDSSAGNIILTFET